MRKLTRLLAVLMLLLWPFAVSVSSPSAAEEGARLTCLNIGKADCLLLQWEGRAYLIDTGYEPNFPAIGQMLSHYGIKKLNGVFLTHCHKDHQGGLLRLSASDIPVDAWYAASLFFEVKTDVHPLYLAAALRGEDVQWLSCGDVIPVGPDASLTVLGPVLLNTDNENNNSLVLRFDCPHGSMLLSGDMKKDEENTLLEMGLLGPCELIKAGRHGDGGATKKAFLAAVQPQAAIISTHTDEDPETPALSLLKRLTKVGCAPYVTQDAQDALEATLLSHTVTVRDIAWKNVPARCTALRMSIDLPDDLLTIWNDSGAPVTLQGAVLYSTKGDDMIPLPDLTLAPGQRFRVGTEATEAEHDFYIEKKRLWHESKPDTAILYDAYGRNIACTDNGITDDDL